jgi:hypothetical protein
MGWFGDLLARVRGASDDDSPVVERPLNMGVRAAQLTELRTTLKEIVEAMQAQTARMDNPGWRGRARDYSYGLGGVRELLDHPTRDGLYEVLGSVRPLYRGPVPEGYEALADLNERLLTVLAKLQEPAAGE